MYSTLTYSQACRIQDAYYQAWLQTAVAPRDLGHRYYRVVQELETLLDAGDYVWDGDDSDDCPF